MTVLAYFKYYQCQSVNDAGPVTSYSWMRDIENSMAAEHIYWMDDKANVTVLA